MKIYGVERLWLGDGSLVPLLDMSVEELARFMQLAREPGEVVPEQDRLNAAEQARDYLVGAASN